MKSRELYPARYCSKATGFVGVMCIALVIGLALATTVYADRIELEVISPPGNGPMVAHDWMQSLKKAKVDRLRLRQDVKVAEPSIESSEFAGETTYEVQAVLIDNRLVVPGARFSRFQMREFNDWLQNVSARANGAKQTHAYGMSAEQLVHVHRELKPAVLIKTTGKSTKRFLEATRDSLSIELRIPAGAIRGQLSELLEDELVGLSSGTALAAALRPLGLVLVPSRTGSGKTDVAVEVREVRDAAENWPIGWPTKTNVKKLAPKMLDFLEVEIDDTPLSEALTAIQGRLELPFLFDWNGMARQNIDPETTKVSFPLRKTYYKKILNNLLYQAKLKSELRVDEAGNPLLWISPIKR